MNGVKVSASYEVQKRDEVVFESKEDVVTKPKSMPQLPVVLYESSEYVVLNKPAGLVIHPNEDLLHADEVTLAHWFVKQYPEVKKVGDEPKKRPGIMHRLDKEVSGVMVVARTQESFIHLKRQFQEHAVHKEYIALVHGKLPNIEGVITFPIARSSRGHRMASRPKNQEGREAVTEYVVKRYLGKTSGEHHGYTLVSVRISTGRTHQIRAHFHALGHPVVGDPLYLVRKQRIRRQLGKDTKSLLNGRIFLHSHVLGFFDEKGVWREYSSELPPELVSFLKQVE